MSLPRRLKGLPRRYLLLGLVFFDLLILYLARYDPAGLIHIWFLPRAGGMLLLTPGARAVLLDGGTDPVSLAEAVGERVPPVWGRLHLAILTRDDDAALATHAELFRRFPPDEAWRPPSKRAQASETAWEDSVQGQALLAQAGLTRTVDGLTVQVAGMAPAIVWIRVGRMVIVYAPDASDEGLRGMDRALAWVIAGLQNKDEAAPLPPIVILPPLSESRLASIAPAILAHPHTRFFVGEEGILHLTTDGFRYRVEVER